MADHQRKHIIVDGVDFRSLFLFPRILEAVWQSLQPARLVIGLLMVLAIIIFGEGWDKLEAPVSPSGLRNGEFTPAEEVFWERIARGALTRYATEEIRISLVTELESDDAEPHPLAVMEAVVDGYREMRENYPEGEAERIQQSDVLFARTFAQLNQYRPRGLWEATRDQVAHGFARTFRGILRLDVPETAGGLAQTFFDTPIHLWRIRPLFVILFSLFLLIVIALGGGAIARMTAVQIALRERLAFTAAFDFSTRSFLRLMLGMLLPLVLAAVAVGLLLLGGLLLAVPWLNVVAALLYGLSLLLGLLVAFLVILWALSLLFVAPAVACENCDGGDAMQKAFAYTIHQPWRLLWYVFVALFGLAIGYAVVAFFGWAVLSITASATGAWVDWHGAQPMHPFLLFTGDAAALPVSFEPARDLRAATYLIDLWEMVVRGLVIGYVLVYIFTSATIIYMLIRRAVDHVDTEQIWLPGLQPGTVTTIPRQRMEGE